MSPKSPNSEGTDDGSVGTKLKERHEVLFEGRYYDVTGFMQRHPGGNVIKFYTEEGEDATEAMLQFHNRSIDKIRLMLKCLPSRDASPNDKGVSEKHRRLTDDFVQLFVEITREGLFAPSYARTAYRATEIVAFIALAFFLLRNPERGLLQSVLGCAAAGMAAGRAGWLMHEGAHHSLTGRPKVDRFIASLFMGGFVGLSAGWWSRGHNKHHAMPQRLHRDVDLDTMPFLAYNAKVVKNRKDGKSFWIQNQTWLFLSIDTFLGYWAWKLYICPRNAWKRGDFFDFLMMSLHWWMAFTVLPTWYEFLLSSWLGANYMFGNFALSHTHLPVTEEATHWVEFGLTHTANVDSSPFVDWWMGYLNFQIEHHLFPTLPQWRCHLVAPRVKALAHKHNLPYHSYSLPTAWAKTLANFTEVAKELRAD